jgi:cell fate regulator YaaT (PSP1 superfamily)
MSLPAGEAPFDCVEVRFKNSRKEYFRNSEGLPLQIGDLVATQATSGHDLGMVTLTGSLVKVQMKKKKVSFTNDDLPKVYRKATEKDIAIWQRCRDREEEIKKRSREIAISLNLQMKLSDVEFQGDGSKATFYYTAEDRVDFRQLIKDMAKAFGIRIEMRQIGYRQEAQRLGGIGSCGRELCCSTWLTDFRSVGTAAARYQQLSLNPQKLAGQCGKLKCCLNFELDVYVDALKDFPAADTKLFTEKGLAFCQKVDIFKEKLWFTYRDDPNNWHTLSKDQVNEILAKNKAKEPVPSLEAYAIEEEPVAAEVVFENVVGQDSLTRFDAPKGRRNKNNKNRNKNRGPRDKAAVQGGNNNKPRKANKPRQAGKAAEGNKPQRNNTPKSNSNGAPTHKKRPQRNPKPKGNNKPNNENQQDTPQQ